MSDRSKPDPDEPWRYVCPDCGRQVHRQPSTTRYRCHHCGESFAFDALRDKARDPR